ncbi:MAG: CotH kinase family protein [Saprospiraceae bacterium]|nr:CotH kinase family protein [Saprospiraceae bacterium]MCF8250119.1 CotH kinase family protein [Saprospiraceae bacterium]MCF8279383.1 CotH kinase family protein [Bacteroidales bacterium]MCF8311173.1 CotH kinase family protein [Saprospiraceae bacterium]MCF8440446.1 CotH kinase family protein [Saprospiraceae bacterium]
MQKSIFTLLCLLFFQLLIAQTFNSSNLPIFIIQTQNSDPILDEPKTTAHLGVIWNGNGEINHVSDPYNNYDGQIGIEVRGSSSQSFPKKNYAVETQNTDSTSLNVALLGFPKENDWVLHGPYSDKTLMRNALAFTMASWIMPYAPRVRLCEVVINGDYRGVYLFTEKIKRDANRLDISKLEVDDNSGDALTGGYILKFDKFDGLVSDGFPSAFPSTTGGIPGGTIYQYHYPKPDEITQPQKAYIQDYISNFENVMASPSFSDPVSGYPSLLDVPSVIQMIFIQEMSRNVDGYRLSTFMYKDRDSVDTRLHLGPVWDYNLGFSNVDYCIGPGYQGWAMDFNNFCPGDYWVVHFWWKKLWNDPAFAQQMHDEWVAQRVDKLSNDKILHLVDSLQALLAEPAQRNFVRWPTLNEYIWPNPVISGSYQAEVARMRTWLVNRLEWMDGAMEALVAVDTTIIVDPPGNELPTVVPSLFHDKVEFYFNVSSYQPVHLEIFDANGRLVHQIERIYLHSKLEKLEWDGSEVPVGVYFYSLKIGKRKPFTGTLMKY